MLVRVVSENSSRHHARFTGHWLAGVGTVLFAAATLLIDIALVSNLAWLDPADAHRGLGHPLFVLLCLTPVHLILLSALTWLMLRMWGLQNLPLRREGSRWLILPTNGQPLAVAAIVLGVLSLPSLIIAHSNGWSKSGSAMLIVWLVLLGLSVLSFGHTRSLIRREIPTVILDDAAAEVVWPVSGGHPAVSVPRSQLKMVEIDDAPATDANGLFTISWQFTDADGHPAERLVFKTRRGLEAVALADWLEDWARFSPSQTNSI
jgi:hypothetical protein